MRLGTSEFNRTTAKKRPLLSLRNKQEQSPVHKQHMRTEPTEVSHIYDLIEETIGHQKECQLKGKYVEAEGFKRKVKQLKQQLQSQQIYGMKNRHEKQIHELEEAHQAEMNLFQLQWEKSMISFDVEIKRAMDELIERHRHQLEGIKEEADRKFHESPKLIQLRNIQQELGKQENYLQAHRVQSLAKQLEKEQLEKHQKMNLNKSKLTLNQLKARQEAQTQALKQRIQTQIQQSNCLRIKQENKLRQKYEIIMKETQQQQSRDLIEFNKSVKLNQLHRKSKVGMFSYSKN